MRNDKEYYILGMPIETEVGKVRFLKYYEYVKHLEDVTMMTLNILHIYYRYREVFKNKNDFELLKDVESIKELSLYEFVLGQEIFLNAYLNIFTLVLDDKNNNIDESLNAIFGDEDMFMKMRELVMNMNMASEEEVSSNPEIQKAIERSRRVKQRESEKQTFSDITSSIVIGSGIDYEKIANMTVLQVYATYYRLNQFKSYDTTSLFATVAEKVSIEAWNKHINLFSKGEEHVIEHSKFKRDTGSVFED